MSRVTSHITISLDGYAAGPNQSEADPLGEGGEDLHRWMFEAAEGSVDAAMREEILHGMGAFVMGRNMFGPIRGEWTGDWRGWWGDEPPYHGPVFVLTHHPRGPLEMEGGTTFHFVTDGIEAAVARAREAAGDAEVSVAGGASTVQQALRAGLLDELVVDISPIVLGGGARLIADVGDATFTPVEVLHSPLATHVRYRIG